MEKLKLHSPDLTAGNIAKIAALFPNCVTEAKGADGTLKHAIDFDLLRQELSAELVEGPQERYRLDWPGKREALATANAPIAKTLRPCPEESVNFDSTKNLYIEGENLETLKLLQESYLGKVKMIYIDPPYNTGHDFVYEDDFSEGGREYFVRSNQTDEEGNRLVANTESNGRFHSDWLSMIYPRIKLSRHLLKDDGLFMISIDDNEFENLKKICDEVFGDENFVNLLIWKKRYNAAKEKHLASIHEHLLVYARDKSQIPDFSIPGDDSYFSKYFKEKDEYFKTRGRFMTQPLEAGNSMDDRPNLRYAITAPDGTKILPRRQWAWSEDRVLAAITTNHLKFYEDSSGAWKVRHKQYEKDDAGNIKKVKPFSIFDKCFTQEGTAEMEEIFKDGKIFPFPKPTKYLVHLTQICNDPEALILDFFSGSGSSAHAVMQLNSEDGGNRRHIMVQLPEACDEKSAAFKAGYKTIAEIGKERIRRAGAKIRAELDAQLKGELPGSDKYQDITAKLAKLDTGFRVLKIDTSNMTDVYYRPDEITQDALALQVENIKPDRSPEDLLFQVLLDWGVDLALPIEQQTIAGKTVFFVDGNALAACFDTGLNEDFVKELAKREPLRAVFRDASFASDSTKINIEQIFKALSPHTELKAI